MFRNLLNAQIRVEAGRLWHTSSAHASPKLAQKWDLKELPNTNQLSERRNADQGRSDLPEVSIGGCESSLVRNLMSPINTLEWDQGGT